jgi:Na+-transporting NADH:ubiquinone oxidoreductase subunit C
VVCSVLLSGVYMALKDKQDLNVKLDKQKNILKAAGLTLTMGDRPMTAEEILALYDARIGEMVIEMGTGNLVEGKKPADVSDKDANLLPLFRLKSEAEPEKSLAYIYPILGKGLWSTLYGYLAVKPNGDEVVGITYYKHGETPGLGAEIEKTWFQKNFIGKRLYRNGKLRGIDVAKGLAKDSPKFASEPNHIVDGMSGATLTGDGVGKMLKVEPRKYEAFFKKISKKSAALHVPQPVKTAMAEGVRQ